jgi:hypothetical protein
MTLHRILLAGHVPTKKNGKRAWAGRVVIDPAVRGHIDALVYQARGIWRARPPIEKARMIRAIFGVRDGRGDLDGKWTTLLDCLVRARVIRNDSIARLPRHITEARIINPGNEEWVEVRIWQE